MDNTAPNYDRINARLRELVPTAQPLSGMLVADHFLGKARRYPERATAYVLSCITRDPHIVENFIHSGRWSE